MLLLMFFCPLQSTRRQQQVALALLRQCLGQFNGVVFPDEGFLTLQSHKIIHLCKFTVHF